MKKITLDEWEKKYIAGPIERFDQKYGMTTRHRWDPEVKKLLKDWSIAGAPKEKAGYSLEDLALRWGSDAGTQMTMLDMFRPNPTSLNKAIMAARSSSNPGGTVIAASPTNGARTDTNDLEKVTRMIKKAARWFGADLVGICKLDRRWLYAAIPTDGNPAPQDIGDEFQYAIVMAYEMDYDLLKYSNTYASNAATRMGYSRMAVTNAHLSAFIRRLGFQAIEASNDTALSVPMAMQAGLGEIGRNGIMITPQFGPRVRLSKIITDLPLIADTPIDFGVTEFCTVCKKCAVTCPSRSISSGDRTTEANNKSNNSGVLKWPINAETCRMYWARVGASCVSCIVTCPYNKPDTWPHRSVRWFSDHARWADPLYVKMDDLLGYGKPKKTGDFWEEWQPVSGYGKTHSNNHK